MLFGIKISIFLKNVTKYRGVIGSDCEKICGLILGEGDAKIGDLTC